VIREIRLEIGHWDRLRDIIKGHRHLHLHLWLASRHRPMIIMHRGLMARLLMVLHGVRALLLLPEFLLRQRLLDSGIPTRSSVLHAIMPWRSQRHIALFSPTYGMG